MQKVGDTMLFFLAGANFGLHTQKFAQVPAAPVLSAPVGSAERRSLPSHSSPSVCQKRLYYCTTLILGSINKCYVIFQVFMVDWQFTVFCRKVGFFEIYAFFGANFC